MYFTIFKTHHFCYTAIICYYSLTIFWVQQHKSKLKHKILLCKTLILGWLNLSKQYCLLVTKCLRESLQIHWKFQHQVWKIYCCTLIIQKKKASTSLTEHSSCLEDFELTSKRRDMQQETDLHKILNANRQKGNRH